MLLEKNNKEKSGLLLVCGMYLQSADSSSLEEMKAEERWNNVQYNLLHRSVLLRGYKRPLLRFA